jgi:redox-sensitive bicupin YhaK (pirin superfamily)
VAELPNGAGTVRVIAGEFSGHAGPARTFTPMNVWDLRLTQGGYSAVTLPAGWIGAAIVLRGEVRINGSAIVRETQMAVLDREGGDLSLEASSDATVLLLSGEPIDEPIVGHGPFVMNTQQEIVQAISDFNSGRFGMMPH